MHVKEIGVNIRNWIELAQDSITGEPLKIPGTIGPAVGKLVNLPTYSMARRPLQRFINLPLLGVSVSDTILFSTRGRVMGDKSIAS